MASCKVCGLDAPLRDSTRNALIKWAVLLMPVQDAVVLSLMRQLHFGGGATAPAGLRAVLPLVCVDCGVGGPD